MKPLNYDNSPCSPISSNCVIWQGPDIPCIKLCAGDTISDVIFKLATELCTVLDTLNVTNYDLSCFNLTACGPNDFQALIQFLIEQICALQTEVTTVSDPATSPLTTGTIKSTGADTLVTVAPCFVIGGITVMTVSEYAQAIGTKVCSLVSQIATINSQINDLDIRVTNLESATIVIPPTPSIVIDCSIGSLIAGNSYSIDLVLDELINNATNGLCSYTNTSTGVLGTPAQLLSSYVTACSFGTDVTTDPNWTPAPNTLPETITNIWIALCAAYSNNTTVAVADTSTIDLSITSGPAYTISAKVTDTGWVDLEGFTYYSGVAKPKCRRIGNQINFRGTIFVPLEDPSSPGSVVTLTSTSAYNSISGCTTWSGVGGCLINSNGAILFNNGGSVIPPSVTAGNLDNTYFKAWDVALRPINVDPTYGTCLASAIRVSITATKGLTVQLVHDIEISTTRGAGVQGNSPLRLVTSNVRAGEYLPNYIGTGTDIHNAPSNANFDLKSDTFNLTWPFSCDAGDENEIGGFYFVIDGLVAYVDPCNTETGLSLVCP